MIVIMYYLTVSLPYIFYHTGMKERKKESYTMLNIFFMVKKTGSRGYQKFTVKIW